MEQLNRAELVGNVGLVFPSKNADSKNIRFTMATNMAFHADDGSQLIDTTWHTITAWEGDGMPDFSLIQKGTPVHVLGRIRNSKYTAADGTEKYSSDIVAHRIEIVS
jgi:single-strand DNA-binding protein